MKSVIYSRRRSTVGSFTGAWNIKKAQANKGKKGENDAAEKGFLPRINNQIRAMGLHFGLIVLCTLYVIIGAWIFLAIERPVEADLRKAALEKFMKRKEELLGNVTVVYSKKDVEEAVDVYVEQLLELFEDPNAATTFETYFPETDAPRDQWTFPSALLLTATTVIPVGYGYVAPVSSVGRWMIVVYGIIGLPLVLVTIADTGKFFEQFVINHFEESTKIPTLLFLGLLILYPLLGGLVLYFTADMSLLDAVYFSLTSIFTIGFGDLAPRVNVVNLILFIVLGVILVTSTIDFVAAEIINHIHYMGRHVGRAKALAGKMLQMAQNLNIPRMSLGMLQLHALGRFGLLGNVDKKVLEEKLKQAQKMNDFHDQIAEFDFADAVSAQHSIQTDPSI